MNNLVPGHPASSIMSTSPENTDHTHSHMEVDSINSDHSSLKLHLMDNPYEYNAHVHFILALRNSGMFEETRAAREFFRSVLLLKEKEWIEWLEDELSISSSFEYLKNLFDSAMKDRLSVPIWLLYLKFCTENGDSFGVDVASEFRRGCAFAGWDLELGHEIWILYALTTGIDLNKTAAVLIPFTQRSIDQIDSSLSIKLNRPEKIRSDPSLANFEFSLLRDNFSSLLNYISVVKGSKALSASDKLTLCRVTLEKVLNFSDSFEIWTFYLNYLKEEMNVPSMILSTSERLTRAHPLNSSSWTSYFEALERSGTFLETNEEVWKNKIPKKLISSSLENFVTLQLARLDSMRRSAVPGEVLINAFRTAIYEEEQHFSYRKHEATDPQGRLTRYFAHVLASIGEIEQCRQAWEQLLKVHAREAAFWLEYIQLEKTFAFPVTADKSKVTALYRRAASAVSDYPETIFYEWIQFERQNGSLESLFDAQKRIEKQRAIILERSEQQQRKQKQQDQTTKKDKSIATSGQQSQQPQRKRTKQELLNEEEEEISIASQKQKEQQQQSTHKPFDPNATLFVNNFPFEFDESAVISYFEKLFARLNTAANNKEPSDLKSFSVKSVRMHRKPNGFFKGHATVEFDSETTARLILTNFPKDLLEGTGRPIFLTKYSSPLEAASTSGRRIIESSDLKTLFISNLSLEVTDEVIHSLLADTQFLQIRRPPGRNFAYVEYEKEETAAGALTKLNGLDICGQKIRVAFSKPPLNPKTTTNTNILTETLSMPPVEPNMATKIISLKPRSVVIKK